MTSNHIPIRTRDYSNVSIIDRLALSRAQHFQTRDNRPKSVSDDEVDGISDWSDSDRECCPLSDFESTSNIDGPTGHFYDIPFDEDNDENKFSNEISYSNISHVNETPLPIIDDSTTSTRISFTSEIEKPTKRKFIKKMSVNPVQLRKQSQPPLLPARRIQTNDVSPRRPSIRSTTNSQLSYYLRNRKTITPSPSRLYLNRETTSTSISLNTHLTKDSTLSSNSSFQSHDKSLYDENHNQRQIVSPNFSQPSVPRAYEIKKIFVDDYDYGRLTDISSVKATPPRNRQKWGTIVHPPFPLGYQHIAPQQVTQTVERLASPLRCRDRHTRLQTPSKRYLSVEETDALIHRLTKVKTIRSPDWPGDRQSRSVKTLNNNWKGVGISA